MSPTVSLGFDPAVDPAWRAAIDHAFRVWAGARSLRVIDAAHPADAAFTYGHRRDDSLPASDAATGRPILQHGLPWFFGRGRRTDHLAEIHAWVAARSEQGAPLDPIGRVDPAASMPRTLGVDPTVPWAERHLDAFDRVAAGLHPILGPSLERSRRAVTILASHDIDFLPLRRRDTGSRLVRNIGVALAGARDPRLAASITAAALRAAATRRPLLGGVETVAAIEQEHGVRATWNVLVRQRHRRDANYDFAAPPVQELLERLAGTGHEVGLHASYTTAGVSGAIAEEMTTLRAAGFAAVGTRQHWLRHDGAALYQEVAKAGARYDSSFGWSTLCGFRHGMARPFVPFDTTTGAPAAVVEVPLVVMDVALSELAGHGVDPEAHVTLILDEAARHGGAVSILWHDTTLSDTQVRPGVGPLYGRLLRRHDRWSTTADAVDAQLPALQAAGLALG